jgi:hypothetical protein
VLEIFYDKEKPRLSGALLCQQFEITLSLPGLGFLQLGVTPFNGVATGGAKGVVHSSSQD